ncbi:4-(cytidine 5'-diphospho)-2-C-methyl-D-erythritol kinase [Gymnodinialimonas hymeniacidonis]|uniref:4-(cytidine 5'-diphospho)-2-C-methyl-D-erythritol kinase n=1 Tax=Gymnodinialimonas hymeniacidonis TaxID=3126508 RepID=UPI0034C63B09
MRLLAPAKVNLALHVVGQREDGLHLLDSLVVFAGVGDWVSVDPAKAMCLRVEGPRAAGVPVDASNIAWKAAEWLGVPADILIEKYLPHAAGIGGGSADAAAVIRALGGVAEGSEALGADVPVCVHGRPVQMGGIGEVLEDVPALPPMWIVLVNPGVEVPTGAVFGAMERVDNAPLPEPNWSDFSSFIRWLSIARNDMQVPAMAMQPVIGDVLDRLAAAEDCALARMSGSGATCFGLFETEATARAAAASMPDEWWAEAAEVLP